jgi:hypothetical protein
VKVTHNAVGLSGGAAAEEKSSGACAKEQDSQEAGVYLLELQKPLSNIKPKAKHSDNIHKNCKQNHTTENNGDTIENRQIKRHIKKGTKKIFSGHMVMKNIFASRYLYEFRSYPHGSITVLCVGNFNKTNTALAVATVQSV